ncbi:hypothetical protein GCM10023195_22370 [Actinoallomurus liliacearum]|uniref:Uncharacterized protein n=1 Tax=Actinoallomurus liliacearum TaxID=1080073 RepID=A0ABP8TGJ3_9ACTN
MDPVIFVTRNGGAVTRARLLRVAGRRSLDQALAEGRLVRPFRGTFALPGTPRSGTEGSSPAHRPRGSGVASCSGHRRPVM